MALRAGYKGFKKLLPGLKIIRPGTLGIDNDVLIQELNKTFFIRSEQAVLGAKNLLPFPYYRGNTYTENGITYTCDEQGRVNINGDLSAQNSTYAFISDKGNNLQWLNGKVLSGFSNGSNQTFDIVVALNQSPWTVYARQTDTDTIISGIPNENVPIAVKIEVRQNMDNVLLSPMISLNGGEFAPYAMTNRELTEKKRDKALVIVSNVSVDTLLDNARYFCNGNMTGLPTGNYGYLDVFNYNNTAYLQVFYPAGTTGKIYTRLYWDNAWSSWYEFTGTELT